MSEAVRAGVNTRPLELTKTFAGKSIVVIGGTGFLGKVFWVMLLARFPGIAQLHLVVRARRGQTAEERFWQDIVPGQCLEPLRRAHGERFEAFLREKVNVVEGDIVQPFCGVSSPTRDSWRGRVDVILNSSGIVDFQPPLDLALEVNAFGVQSLVALARDVGDVPIIHTSTCYVAGKRTGIIEEHNPLEHPFPFDGTLERAHWDPDREIDECLDIIRQARHRAGDAFRQSHFLYQAKQNLKAAGEPERGTVLEEEIARVRRKFIEAQLAELGQERAQFWGWANTYTYTKSIGEQIAARSGLRFSIVRPAIIESCVAFPEQGWNEGINTSAPLIFAIREGQFQMPGSDIRLDIVPCDMVATGMLLATAELLLDEHKPVYQFGTSDSNPTTMARIYELSGLYKRKYYQRTGRGGPLVSYVQSHIEGALLSPASFDRFGPKRMAQGALALSGALSRASASGSLTSFFKPTIKGLNQFAKTQSKVYDIIKQFEPFVASFDYEFRCDNTRAAFARTVEADKPLLVWSPETLDWRKWFLETHLPGLERFVFPEMERRLKKPVRSIKRYDTLVDLLSQMAERYDLAPALSRTEHDGLTRVTFRDWHERALACASRLVALGVQPRDRVLLVAKNHPDWAISLFGILCAGATAVPLDAEVDGETADLLLRASGAVVALFDEQATRRLGSSVGNAARVLSLSQITAPGNVRALPSANPGETALLIYTSGTTGKPKGVMLTHDNLCSMLASLAPLFPLDRDDRVLSVLPLHHTFELTCGLLLPLARGSRVIYLDELNAERLTHALQAGRITAMIGVPALWEMLERKILARVAENGGLASRAFDIALEVSRAVGRNTGVDIGKLLFGRVHGELGGHLRFMVSGGAALGESTQQLFAGLGLHLTEGYGLTEAAPVLSVATAGPRNKPKQVGRAVPDVELEIRGANEDGVGEIVARGPNVMAGYSDDPESTRAVLDAEGWLSTGDLGKLDHRGRLAVVGRAKDVIVASNGENVYPDDVEARLGLPQGIAELAVVGVSDDRGGERVACAAVVLPEPARELAHARARKTLDAAIAHLPQVMRPTIVMVFDAPLPRTSTRKVQRKELRQLVERRLHGVHVSDASAVTSVRRSIAVLTRREPKTISSQMTLRGDLGLDSLMLLDLLVALETQVGRSIDAARLDACQTVADAENLMREMGERSDAARIEPEESALPIDVPDPLRRAAKQWMGRAQGNFYQQVMRTRVTGRAFIPRNKNVLVIANHASHLDMGLIKYALGAYGRDMVSLAAQDYFFDGKYRKAFFENFSNLVPVSRTGSLRQLVRTAGDLLSQGNVVLLFPEGTRSPDGLLQDFKPALGYLALQSQVDILPIWLEGTYRALPKGATVVRSRKLEARIGPVLTYMQMKARTQGGSLREASRTVTQLARAAVEALSQGRVLDLSGPGERAAAKAEARTPGAPAALVGSNGASARTSGGVPEERLPELRVPEKRGLEAVFDKLRGQFVRGATERPVSYYFSLGEERWSLVASAEACEIKRGRLPGSADCVLKTSPAMFERIVNEAYTPSASEFMSGRVKSNNVQLLYTFQKLFGLTQSAGRA